MSLKLLLGSVALGIIVVVGGYFVIAPKVSDAPSAPEAEDVTEEYGEQKSEEEVEIEDEGDEREDSEDAVEEPATPVTTTQTQATPAQVPAPTPVPTPTPAPAPAGYTKAEVAIHASQASCWSTINGSVYDLTAFVSKHPGGESRILKICGKDGTSLFEGQHGGDSKPESMLAKYRLGDLI